MVDVALRPRSATGRFLEWHRGLDWPILTASILLLCTGLLMSLAAGPPAAERLGYSDDFYFVRRQAMFVGAAVIVMIGTSLLERVWARRIAALVFVVSLALLAFILVSGHEVKGAQRWLRIGGFSLQPSEFVKPALIVLTGWLLAQRSMYPKGPWAAITLVFFHDLGLLAFAARCRPVGAPHRGLYCHLFCLRPALALGCRVCRWRGGFVRAALCDAAACALPGELFFLPERV